MQLNVEVSLIICFRISSSNTSVLVVVADISVVAIATVSISSALFVVADISVVAIAPVAVVVDIIGMLRVRGTVDTHRLPTKPLLIGVNTGAAMPN